jgi:hypothetical protein
VSADLVARLPACGAVVRGRADVLDRATPGAGRAVLADAKALLATSPRTMVVLARRLRTADDRHDDALALERHALAAAAGDVVVLDAVEVAWRQARPLASVADVEAFVADADVLLAAADDRARAFSYRNDLVPAARRGRVVRLARQGARRASRSARRRRPGRSTASSRWYDGAVARIPTTRRRSRSRSAG